MALTKMEMKSPLAYSIVWLIMLVLLTYPLAWFLVWFWVLLMPLEHIFEPVKQLNDLLEKFITWPRMVGKAIWQSDEDFPNPMQATQKERGGDNSAEGDAPDNADALYTLC